MAQIAPQMAQIAGADPAASGGEVVQMAQIAVPATTPPQTAAAQQLAAMQAQIAASQQQMMEMEQQHQQEMQTLQLAQMSAQMEAQQQQMQAQMQAHEQEMQAHKQEMEAVQAAQAAQVASQQLAPPLATGDSATPAGMFGAGGPGGAGGGIILAGALSTALVTVPDANVMCRDDDDGDDVAAVCFKCGTALGPNSKSCKLCCDKGMAMWVTLAPAVGESVPPDGGMTPWLLACKQQVVAGLEAGQQEWDAKKAKEAKEMKEWQQHLEAAGGSERYAMAQGGRKPALVEPACCGCIFCCPAGAPHQPAKIVRRPAGCGTSVISFDHDEKSRYTFDCCIKEHSNSLAACCICICTCLSACAESGGSGGDYDASGNYGGGGGYAGGDNGFGGGGGY